MIGSVDHIVFIGPGWGGSMGWPTGDANSFTDETKEEYRALGEVMPDEGTITFIVCGMDQGGGLQVIADASGQTCIGYTHRCRIKWFPFPFFGWRYWHGPAESASELVRRRPDGGNSGTPVPIEKTKKEKNGSGQKEKP